MDCSEDKDLKWEEIYTEHLIQDEWIDFRRSSFRFPDGAVYEPFYTYSRRDFAVVVASDTDGQYICVRQFRQGIREVTTEFPAGVIEAGDGAEKEARALEAAKRELREETGYVSDAWRHLITIPSNATISDNYVYVYSAENCRKLSAQDLDKTEFLNVRNYCGEELEDMIRKGAFQQAIHVMAWLLSQKAGHEHLI